MNWSALRLQAQSVAFGFFAEPMRIVVGSDTLDPINAVLDTTQSKIKLPDTDGSYTVSAQLFVWRSDFGDAPHVDEVIEIKNQKYLVRFCDTTTELYEIHLQATGF